MLCPREQCTGWGGDIQTHDAQGGPHRVDPWDRNQDWPLWLAGLPGPGGGDPTDGGWRHRHREGCSVWQSGLLKFVSGGKPTYLYDLVENRRALADRTQIWRTGPSTVLLCLAFQHQLRSGDTGNRDNSRSLTLSLKGSSRRSSASSGHRDLSPCWHPLQTRYRIWPQWWDRTKKVNGWTYWGHQVQNFEDRLPCIREPPNRWFYTDPLVRSWCSGASQQDEIGRGLSTQDPTSVGDIAMVLKEVWFPQDWCLWTAHGEEEDPPGGGGGHGGKAPEEKRAFGRWKR